MDIIDVWAKNINSLRPRQNGRLFADDTFKHIFLNENIRISTKNSLKFVPKGLITNIPALVLIMDWRRPGDKPLSEPKLVRSLTHICVTRPQWVKTVKLCTILFTMLLWSERIPYSTMNKTIVIDIIPLKLCTITLHRYYIIYRIHVCTQGQTTGQLTLCMWRYIQHVLCFLVRRSIFYYPGNKTYSVQNQ